MSESYNSAAVSPGLIGGANHRRTVRDGRCAPPWSAFFPRQSLCPWQHSARAMWCTAPRRLTSPFLYVLYSFSVLLMRIVPSRIFE